MEDKNLYPNTFQVNNFYIDKCLHLLDGNEIKVLLYVIRRIVGFNKQFDRISLGQFENGIVSRSGERLDSGVGISKPSIVKALNELNKYGFLIELERSNNPRLGNAYTLQFDYSKINLIALEERELNKGKSTSKKSLLVKNIDQLNSFTSKKSLLVDQLKNEQKSVDLLVNGFNTQNSVREEKNKKEEEIGEHSSSVAFVQKNLSPSKEKTIVEKSLPETNTVTTKTKPKSTADPLSSHAAILAVREILGRYPSKLIYPQIVAILGDNPDLAKLRNCATEWAKISSNIGNLKTWLFDWYKNGMPLNNYKQTQSKPVEPTPKRHLTADEWRAIDAEKERNRPVSDIDPSFDIKAALAAMKQDIVNKRSYQLVGN